MFDITITGLDDISRKLDDLELATNTNDILDTASAYMLHRIRERFLDQVDSDGVRWEVSEAAKRRKASGRDGGTLFDTGTLFHSLSAGRAGKDTRRIFTDVTYARKHNFGQAGQVRREFLAFSLDDRLGVLNIINDRIKKAIK